MKINDVCEFLEAFAPPRLAEEWDNVGLLVGDPELAVTRIMTCLTVTPESAEEALERDVNLIVSHHPLPFRPLKRITADRYGSQLLWKLIRQGVSIYSPHTSFDSAALGINQMLAERLKLQDIRPLNPIAEDPDGLGSGRVGTVARGTSLGDLVDRAKTALSLPGVRFVGTPDSQLTRIAVACGSGGSFLEQAIRDQCNAFVTGEAQFHTCLEAQARGASLLLLGHYASERFAVEELAVQLAKKFPDLEIWASARESDPISTG